MWQITLTEHEAASAAQVRELKTLMEKMMAQLDDLQTTETAVKSDLDQIKSFLASQADRLQALQDQLTQLQQTTPPQVDLQPAIDAATAIREEADQIVASFTPAAPEPAPAPVSDPTAGSTDSTSSDSSSTDTSGSSADAGSTDPNASSSSGSSDTSGSTDAGDTPIPDAQP